MTKQMISVNALSDLKRGDVIRGKSTGRVFVVIANYGSHVTAVDTQDVTNPSEWEVLRPIEPKEPPEPTLEMIRQGVWAWARTPSNSIADDVRAMYIAMRRMEGSSVNEPDAR